MKSTTATIAGLLAAAALLTYCTLFDGVQVTTLELPGAGDTPSAGRPQDIDDASGIAGRDADPAPDGSAAPRSDVAAAPGDGGIWIIGTVHGIDRSGEHVRVTVEHPRSRQKVFAHAGADGHVELLVTGLVEQDQRSSLLRATFEHPERLQQSVSIVLEGGARRMGLGGTRVEVPVEVRLQPVTRRIEGVVRIPVGYPMQAVRVVLLEGASEGALPELVDETTPRGDGQFRLGGRTGREAHVVAWLNATVGDRQLLLRPTTVRLPAWMRDAASLALELEAGSELVGMVMHAGQMREVQLQLTARLDVDSVAEEAPAPAHPPDQVAQITPRALDEGDSEDLLEAAVPAPARPRKVAEVLAAPRRFVELVYVAGRFEFAAVPVRVGSDGRFRTAGLRPATYDLGDGRLVLDGRTIAACPGQERTWVSAAVPSAGVQTRFPVHLCLLRVLGEGRSLANQVVRIDSGRAQAISDGDGRVVFAAPTGTGRFKLTLSVIGYLSQTLWVSADRWQEVELKRRPEKARRK